MTGIDLILLATLINYTVNYFSTSHTDAICSVKTYMTYDDKTTEVQRPVFCKDLGL